MESKEELKQAFDRFYMENYTVPLANWKAYGANICSDFGCWSPFPF